MFVHGQCGIATHKRCLETLTYECGHREPAPQRRMTTFGVDFCSQVPAMHRSVPQVVVQCTTEIDSRALDFKVHVILDWNLLEFIPFTRNVTFMY